MYVYLGKGSKITIAGCSKNVAAFKSYRYSFSYKDGLQMAVEYGGCSQCILTSPLMLAWILFDNPLYKSALININS